VKSWINQLIWYLGVGTVGLIWIVIIRLKVMRKSLYAFSVGPPIILGSINGIDKIIYSYKTQYIKPWALKSTNSITQLLYVTATWRHHRLLVRSKPLIFDKSTFILCKCINKRSILTRRVTINGCIFFWVW